jgi:uncharacterized membrane protein
MMKKLILIAILAIFIISTANASEYYADIVMDISSNGDTQISGTTNHPLLSERNTTDFISMQKGDWTFEANFDSNFAAYLFEIILPADAQITSSQISGEYRIATKDNRIAIIASGEEKQLSININYKTQPQPPVSNYIPLGAAIIIILGIIIIFIIKEKVRGKTKPAAKETSPLTVINKEALTERQILIVEYLERKGKSATQKEIELALKLPKASLSRNLATLEHKGIVKKEEKGMTMIVWLNTKK